MDNLMNNLKPGQHSPVGTWANYHWPKEAEVAITKHIPNYQKVILFGTAEDTVTTSDLHKGRFEIILDYHESKHCYLAYNAALRECNSKAKKIKISFGKNVKDCLSQVIPADAIFPVYQDIGKTGLQVELVLVIGENAIDAFCKSYKSLMVPDATLIPYGKTCLYAVPGGKVQEIQSTKKRN